MNRFTAWIKLPHVHHGLDTAPSPIQIRDGYSMTVFWPQLNHIKVFMNDEIGVLWAFFSPKCLSLIGHRARLWTSLEIAIQFGAFFNVLKWISFFHADNHSVTNSNQFEKFNEKSFNSKICKDCNNILFHSLSSYLARGTLIGGQMWCMAFKASKCIQMIKTLRGWKVYILNMRYDDVIAYTICQFFLICSIRSLLVLTNIFKERDMCNCDWIMHDTLMTLETLTNLEMNACLLYDPSIKVGS